MLSEELKILQKSNQSFLPRKFMFSPPVYNDYNYLHESPVYDAHSYDYNF